MQEYRSGIFILAHLMMEALAGVAADVGYMGPTYLFIGLMLLAYLIHGKRRHQPWYKVLLLFVPLIAGVLLDEMFDALSDDLAEKHALLALLAPLAMAVVYAGLCICLWPGLKNS
jgi:hypothetical protein